jgi:hypothetical protein
LPHGQETGTAEVDQLERLKIATKAVRLGTVEAADEAAAIEKAAALFGAGERADGDTATRRKGEITRGDFKRKRRDATDFGVFWFSKPQDAEGFAERFGNSALFGSAPLEGWPPTNPRRVEPYLDGRATGAGLHTQWPRLKTFRAGRPYAGLKADQQAYSAPMAPPVVNWGDRARIRGSGIGVAGGHARQVFAKMDCRLFVSDGDADYLHILVEYPLKLSVSVPVKPSRARQVGCFAGTGQTSPPAIATVYCGRRPISGRRLAAPRWLGIDYRPLSNC